jgi:hypothetical protein
MASLLFNFSKIIIMLLRKLIVLVIFTLPTLQESNNSCMLDPVTDLLKKYPVCLLCHMLSKSPENYSNFAKKRAIKIAPTSAALFFVSPGETF